MKRKKFKLKRLSKDYTQCWLIIRGDYKDRLLMNYQQIIDLMRYLYHHKLIMETDIPREMHQHVISNPEILTYEDLVAGHQRQVARHYGLIFKDKKAFIRQLAYKLSSDKSLTPLGHWLKAEKMINNLEHCDNYYTHYKFYNI
jgi:hypothetical protein